MAVSSENAQGTRAALSVLERGGNAVDAAVTSALVGGVASPTSSGLGGGGFVVAWDARRGEPFVLDFREHAPTGLEPEIFESRPLPPGKLGQLVGVPGEPAGLYELQSRLGRLSWADVVEPARRLALLGFKVEEHLASMLGPNPSVLRKDAGLRAVFFPGGRPARRGQTLRNVALGRTLGEIAKFGPRAFYEGPIAEDVVAAARAIGGTLTVEEMRAYRPIVREPIRVAWGEHEVLTMPPPSAGGLMVAQTLKLFSKPTLVRLGLNSAVYQHVLAEALRGSFVDRLRFIGDPDRVGDATQELLSPQWIARRARQIAVDRTHRLPHFAGREAGTHAIVTADADGNMVSLTTTVNRLFGVKASAVKSGVVLNDQLDDFTERRDVLPFGLHESPNRPAARARPVSSMTPTLVTKNGRAVLGIGGSGGLTIATNVTQLLLAVLAFDKTPAEAVKLPRFYVWSGKPTMLLEAGTPREISEELSWRGETLADMPFTTSAVQIVSAGPSGEKLAASDPRKHGFAETR